MRLPLPHMIITWMPCRPAPNLCRACRAAWYCGTACSHADWRAGHKRVCKALGTARVANKERRQAAAAAAVAAEEPEAQ